MRVFYIITLVVSGINIMFDDCASNFAHYYIDEIIECLSRTYDLYVALSVS